MMQGENYLAKSGDKILLHCCSLPDEIAALKEWFLSHLVAWQVALACRNACEMKHWKERDGPLCTAALLSIPFFYVFSLVPIKPRWTYTSQPERQFFITETLFVVVCVPLRHSCCQFQTRWRAETWFYLQTKVFLWLVDCWSFMIDGHSLPTGALLLLSSYLWLCFTVLDYYASLFMI